jgi:hypothetical protein
MAPDAHHDVGPMIGVGAVLLLGGAGIGSLIPVLGCSLMLLVMMSFTGGGHGTAPAGAAEAARATG